MDKNPLIDSMRLDGGIVCLDFVNTVPDRRDGSNRDNLKGFNDLIYWARKAGILDKTSFTDLERAGNHGDRKAKDFFSEAIELRSLVYSIFHPISRQERVKPADLEAFNKQVARYFAQLGLALQKDKFVEHWKFSRGHFYSITAPIIKTAYELLLSEKLVRVKECPSCGWLFLDGTKNGKRKWCSMEDCGSTSKALDWYYRNKK